MKEQEATLALWSAVMITFFVVLFIVSMILYPIGEFKDLATYSEAYGFRSIAPAIPSFFIAMLHFPLLVGLYCFAREDRKVFRVRLSGSKPGGCDRRSCPSVHRGNDPSHLTFQATAEGNSRVKKIKRERGHAPQVEVIH